MVNNKITILVLLLIVPILCGCVSQNEAPTGKIRVAATIAPLSEFVKIVGGDKVAITVIVPPGAEPHTFEPTPSQMREVANADLYVMNGAGLEFWMAKMLQANERMVVLDSSQGIALLQESEGQIDPHIWLSLRNAAVQVDNICSGMIEVDPQNKDYYKKNRDNYLEKLKALDEELNRTFASKKSKVFVVHHPAWTYFARDYGLSQVPLMENEKEPGPKYLGEVVDLAKKSNIKTIFVEPEYNPKAAEVIAREMNASIISLDPLAENYLVNMARAGREIAKSLA
jgi:zinc transport system substrate-binding protein